MLHKPRLTFDRLGQVIFTLREIIKIIAQVEKKLLVGIVDKEGEVTYYEIRWKKP